MTVTGEDRSSFQPVTGWAGDSFGFAKATEGTSWKDPAFAANWANLKKAGLVRGAYHFFHPADSPVTQAEFFFWTVQAQGIDPGDVFVADVEITVGAHGTEEYGTRLAPRRGHEGLRQLPASAPVGAGALEFLGCLAALAGEAHRLVLYTDVSMAQGDLPGCAAYPLFVAYYSSQPLVPAPWKTWTFWQSGETGPGGGDGDYFNGDLAALREWALPGPQPLPPGWVYPPVRGLAAAPGKTSVRLEWSAPAQVPGFAPMPAIGGYDIAIARGATLDGPELASYPRHEAKGANPEVWQGGSLPGATQCTAGVRAVAATGGHAGDWETVTFTTA